MFCGTPVLTCHLQRPCLQGEHTSHPLPLPLLFCAFVKDISVSLQINPYVQLVMFNFLEVVKKQFIFWNSWAFGMVRSRFGLIVGAMYVRAKLLSEVQLFVALWAVTHQAFLCQWNSPHRILSEYSSQGIFSTWGSNPGFPTMQGWTLLPSEHLGSPILLVWLVSPFIGGKSKF